MPLDTQNVSSTFEPKNIVKPFWTTRQYHLTQYALGILNVFSFYQLLTRTARVYLAVTAGEPMDLNYSPK